MREWLAQWLYETMPRRSDVGRYTWDALPDDARGKPVYLAWADALMETEAWQAWEAVVNAAAAYFPDGFAIALPRRRRRKGR